MGYYTSINEGLLGGVIGSKIASKFRAAKNAKNAIRVSEQEFQHLVKQYNEMKRVIESYEGKFTATNKTILHRSRQKEMLVNCVDDHEMNKMFKNGECTKIGYMMYFGMDYSDTDDQLDANTIIDVAVSLAKKLGFNDADDHEETSLKCKNSSKYPDFTLQVSWDDDLTIMIFCKKNPIVMNTLKESTIFSDIDFI